MPLSETPGSCRQGDNVAPHRRRRFAAKARTGCITCKIRRIKCDEVKPFCYRCTSTGRKCDGYATHKPVKPPSPSALASSRGCPEERQALYMFRTKIAMSISSALDLGFWTRDILQTAEAYQTVQHAVIALASAYHSSILSDRECQTRERQFVLLQYNKSISSLQDCLKNPRLTRDQQVVILMVNVVFICICAIQGSREEACLHFRKGLSLFHEWQFGVKERWTASAPTSLMMLATVYTQLDTQARIIINSNSPHKMSVWPHHAVALDGCGNGHSVAITEAVGQLERLHNASIQMTTLSESSEGARLCLEELSRQLQVWDSDFGWLVSPSHQGSNHAKALQIRRLVAGANLSLRLSRTEQTPECNPSWAEDILILVREIIQDSICSEAGVVFTPAGGLVEALYFVAMRCDDNRGRKATELLERYHIIEGLWNTPMAFTALNQHIRTRQLSFI